MVHRVESFQATIRFDYTENFSSREDSQPAEIMKRTKSRQNLLLLEHRQGKKLLKVIQKRTNRLATMGIIRDRCHFFYPEEGVWLMEANQALILFNGLPMSIQQSFHLLATSQISFPKYFVYSYLKRAGYIVLPTNRGEETPNLMKDLQPNDLQPKGRFPQHLLDQFPTISSRKPDSPELHKQSNVTEKFGVSSEFPAPKISSFRLTHRPHERLRPGYWPRFDEAVRRVHSWAAYRDLLGKLSRCKRPAKSSISMTLQPHYDVYANDGSYSHTIVPPPLFQIYIIEDSEAGFPSQAELLELSGRVCTSKLVIAIVRQPTVLFYDVSHQSVRL